MQASLTGIALTAVADGLPGFRWCKRNEVVYIDLPEKMSLIIALIIRLIWEENKKKQEQKQKKKRNRGRQRQQRPIEYTYIDSDKIKHNYNTILNFSKAC